MLRERSEYEEVKPKSRESYNQKREEEKQKNK